MNLKERLVRSLIKLGKKNKLLVYPTLALIAVVTAVSNVIGWGKGNGKKLVAGLMVFALLVTQSLVLTSSANDPDPSPEAETVAENSETTPVEYTLDPEDPTVILDYNEPTEAVTEEATDPTVISDEAKADPTVISDEDIINLDAQENEDNAQTDDLDDSDDTALADAQEDVNEAKSGRKVITETDENGETVYVEEAEEINAPGDTGEPLVYLYVNGQKTNTQLEYTIDDTSTPGTTKITLQDASSATAFANACAFLELNQDYFKLDTAANGSYLYKDGALKNAVANGVIFEGDSVPNEIGVYCTVSRTKYTVKVEDSTVPADEGLSITNGTSEALCGAPNASTTDRLTLDAMWKVSQNGVGGFGCYRRGYDYTGVKFESSTFVAGADAVISNSSDTISVAPTWQAKSGLKLTYHVFNDEDKAKIAVAPEGQDIEQTGLTYGETVTLKGYDDVKAYSKNSAYYLAGWLIDGTSTVIKPTDGAIALTIASKLAKIKGEVNDVENVEGVSLTGVWDYKKLSLSSADTANVSIDNTTKTDAVVSLTYGDTASFSITGQYSYDGVISDKVTFKINQTDATKLANECGISIAPGGDNSIRITQTATSVTDDDGIVVNVEAEDQNRSIGDTMVTPCTITVKVLPRKVELDETTVVDPSEQEAPSKTYNGTRIIPVFNRAKAKNAIDEDEVRFVFSSSAEAETEVAGGPYDITLNNVRLSAKAGKEGCYVIDDSRYDNDNETLVVNKIATIKKSPLNVKVELAEGESGSIKFGMDSPKFRVTIPDSSEVVAGTERNLCESDPDTFVKNYLEFDSWTDSRPSVYSPKGSYTMTPNFNESNYTVITDPKNIGTYTVDRDKAVDGEVFTKSGTLANGIYKELSVKPAGNYDKVKLVTRDIIPEDTRSYVREGGKNEWIINESMYNQTLYFIVYNSNDNSVAEMITLSNISIDADIPVLESYSVTPTRESFFDPTVKFGGYYRSGGKDGNADESVTFEFIFRTKGSAIEKVCYYFADENGKRINDKLISVEESITRYGDLSDNRYKVAIPLGIGTKGQLIVYAVDELEKASVPVQIKLNSKNGQSDENVNNYYNDNNTVPYYEWVIENTISSAVISVSDSSGSKAVSSAAASPVWYRGITFEVDAEDKDSGINKIEWLVTKPDGTTAAPTEEVNQIRNVTSFGKVTECVFKTTVPGDDKLVGSYYASAKLYDNSGNVAEIGQVGPYMVDPISPRISLENEDDSAEFSSDYVFNFTVTEPVDESGVKAVYLYKNSIDSEPLKIWGALDKYSYTITENGTYTVVAEDNAGNKSAKEINFGKISTVIPENPKITVSVQDGGRIGSAGWYIIKEPLITIDSSTKTSDGLPVTTVYKVEGDENMYSDMFTSTKREFVLGDDANDHSEWENEVKISAYAATSANTSKTVTQTFKVDTKIPVVDITSSVVTDGTVTVNFKVTDEVSGVDTTKVYVNGKAVPVTSQDGLVTGSFSASGEDNYTIYAYDIAGNVSEEVSFKPLVLDAYPVTNITTSSADVSAYIHKGSADLDVINCYIEYKKADSGSYLQALNTKETLDNGDMELAATFSGLKSDTEYDYRIHARTKNSNEHIVKTGKFRTKGYGGETSLQGTASYSIDADKSYPIYVNLYRGNTVIAGAKVTDAANPNYVFNNIADGDYRIEATDGTLKDEASVTVTAGVVSYPENYIAAGGVHLVLRGGMSTAVEIEDDDLMISVDGLDKIYNTELYRGNVTPDDLATVADGGRIVITLHAETVNVTGLEKSVLEEGIGKKGEIVKYIQLYVIKEVFDANGNYTNYTPMQLSHLAEPLRITIGLEDLAGQRIKVASLHGNGEEGYTFMDGEDYESVVLTDEYITICTNMFSVYALYREADLPNEYTVRWLDGDGNVMKTETVTEGSDATPPTETPTKTATERYSYLFARWDRTYDRISADATIQALFVAHKKTVTWLDGDGNVMKTAAVGDSGSTEAPAKTPTKKSTSKYDYIFTGWKKSVDKETGDITYQALFKAQEKKSDTTEDPGTTEKPTTETPTTETPSTDQPTTSKPAEVDPQKKAKETTPVYGYMGTGSPDTGDEAPIAAVTLLMLTAGAGAVILGRKKKNSR